MTALAIPAAEAGPWPRHLGALVLVVAVLLAAFVRDAAAVAHLWWTSTTFGHCLFVGPVLAWLVWQRRGELARLDPVAWAPGLVVVAIGGCGWLLGEAGTVAVARQFGLLLMIEGAVLTLLGPNVARGLSFPLAYAGFLIPFGAGLEPPLQVVTVRIAMPLLHMAGLTASVDGVLIHASAYRFEVAEACSGAKFVLAMAAFGILVAGTCFDRWPRRIAFVAVALVVPVLANGIRAFATIYAADRISLEAATGFDHIVYGWLFFGIVMAAVLAIGWRWFDRAPDAPAFDPAALRGVPRHLLPLGTAVLLTVATAATFPVWAAAGASRRAVLPDRILLPVVPGWTRLPVERRTPWQPATPGADHVLFGRYGDGRDVVDVAIAAYARQHDGAKLVGFGIGALREEDRWVRIADLPPIAAGRTVRIAAPGPVERIVATWYRLDGMTLSDDTRVKIATMQARLAARDPAAVAVYLSVPTGSPATASRAIGRFLRAAGDPGRIADRAIGRAR